MTTEDHSEKPLNCDRASTSRARRFSSENRICRLRIVQVCGFKSIVASNLLVKTIASFLSLFSTKNPGRFKSAAFRAFLRGHVGHGIACDTTQSDFFAWFRRHDTAGLSRFLSRAASLQDEASLIRSTRTQDHWRFHVKPKRSQFPHQR